MKTITLPSDPVEGQVIHITADNCVVENAKGWVVSETEMKYTYGPLKVLFLDFDDCMTSRGYGLDGVGTMGATAVKLVSEFLRRSGYKVVISSVWRSHMENAIIAKKIMGCSGFPVNFDYLAPDHITGCNKSFRGHNIDSYLKRHPEVTEYIIVDDSCDFFEDQFERFVHVDGMEGFGIRDLARCLTLAGVADRHEEHGTLPFIPRNEFGGKASWMYSTYLKQIKTPDDSDVFQRGEVIRIGDDVFELLREWIPGKEPLIVIGTKFMSANCKTVTLPEVMLRLDNRLIEAKKERNNG